MCGSYPLWKVWAQTYEQTHQASRRWPINLTLLSLSLLSLSYQFNCPSPSFTAMPVHDNQQNTNKNSNTNNTFLLCELIIIQSLSLEERVTIRIWATQSWYAIPLLIFQFSCPSHIILGHTIIMDYSLVTHSIQNESVTAPSQ